MCRRYAAFGPVSLSREANAMLEQLQLDIRDHIDQRDGQFNIAPTQRALVAFSGRRRNWIESMRWGLIPSRARDMSIGAQAFNAAVETVRTKPIFRHAFRRQRCLVPASGYFEWKGAGPSEQPYFVYDPSGNLMLFAGLWDAWKPLAEDFHVRSFTIITGPLAKISEGGRDRRPIILPPALWPAWLTGTPEEAAAVLATSPEAELAYHPVPKAVGSPGNKGAELVRPVVFT